MVIAPSLADRYIAAYMAFLGTLVSEPEKAGKRPSQWLVIGRARYVADRATLAAYRAQHPQADAEMLEAIAALQVQDWCYLRDTSSYSVLLAGDGSAAHGVLGLTERLRDVMGCSGRMFRTGLLPIRGRWVCDGLMEGDVLIGKQLRQDLNSQYQALRQAGRFSTGPDRAA
jgi:hypothetical protein